MVEDKGFGVGFAEHDTKGNLKGLRETVAYYKKLFPRSNTPEGEVAELQPIPAPIATINMLPLDAILWILEDFDRRLSALEERQGDEE